MSLIYGIDKLDTWTTFVVRMRNYVTVTSQIVKKKLVRPAFMKNMNF